MIYNMNQKELKRLLIDFSKTRYGKSMFIICYAVFFLLFLTIIILCFLKQFLLVGMLSLLCLISFCIGSYAYYKELRIFVDKVR